MLTSPNAIGTCQAQKYCRAVVDSRSLDRWTCAQKSVSIPDALMTVPCSQLEFCICITSMYYENLNKSKVLFNKEHALSRSMALKLFASIKCNPDILRGSLRRWDCFDASTIVTLLSILQQLPESHIMLPKSPSIGLYSLL